MYIHLFDNYVLGLLDLADRRDDHDGQVVLGAGRRQRARRNARRLDEGT